MKNGTMGAGQSPAPGRGVLVAAQVAGTLVLLIAAGLCLRSFAKLSELDLGFNPAQVLTFAVNGLDEAQFPSRAARHDLVDSPDREHRAGAAGPHGRPVSSSAPSSTGRSGMDSSVLLEGQADTPDESNRNGVLNWESVTPRYFDSMHIRLLRGRIFRRARQCHCRPQCLVPIAYPQSRIPNCRARWSDSVDRRFEITIRIH